jgi:hypothetical protein
MKKYPKKKNSNGLSDEQIIRAVNRLTSTTARLTRLIIDGNDSETKRQATNHLYTLKWAIEQFAEFPHESNLVFFLKWIKDLDEFGKCMTTFMQEEETIFLVMMSKRYTRQAKVKLCLKN